MLRKLPPGLETTSPAMASAVVFFAVVMSGSDDACGKDVDVKLHKKLNMDNEHNSKQHHDHQHHSQQLNHELNFGDENTQQHCNNFLHKQYNWHFFQHSH